MPPNLTRRLEGHDAVRDRVAPIELHSACVTGSFKNFRIDASCQCVRSRAPDYSYFVATEMYPIYIRHNLDVQELGLFRTARQLQSTGLYNKQGELVDRCARASRCFTDEIAVVHHLQASGIFFSILVHGCPCRLLGPPVASSTTELTI